MDYYTHAFTNSFFRDMARFLISYHIYFQVLYFLPFVDHLFMPISTLSCLPLEDKVQVIVVIASLLFENVLDYKAHLSLLYQ